MHDDSRTEAAHPRALRVRAAELEVVRGVDAGRTARVDSPATFVIGAGEQADLRLRDTTVSREHLRLSLTPEGVHVRDEGSKNGTWIGSVRVSDALVTADCAIELGTTAIALRLEATPRDVELSTSDRFGGAIGVSSAIRHVFAVLEKAAASDVTVLLEGESGVGKEVLAHAVHDASARADGAFFTVDCGAIPAGLIESELFGHERGAFTGATDARKGAFELADGGTLFLDEIGELSIDLQPKLLRALEAREIRPVGARATKKVDVRVIAATNRRLAEAAQRGEFRPDLFYRLAVARVTVPPLRDRRDDVAPLARAFLRAATRDDSAELPPDLAAMLAAYAWPGNVRELRNVIDRWALLGARDPRHLFDATSPGPIADDLVALPYHEARRRALDAFERAYVPGVLARAGGVVARAAEAAQVARPSFYRMLERLRVQTRDDE